jgi:hypothetical protein
VPFRRRQVFDASTPPTYSHVVEVNGPQTVYLAGQTRVDATGKIAEGFRAQAVENQFVAVVDDNEPFVCTVLCRTVANTLSMGFVVRPSTNTL